MKLAPKVVNDAVPSQPILSPPKDEEARFRFLVQQYVAPKRDLMLMLRFAKFDEPWAVNFFGTRSQADRHVSNMRVHMSRLRAESVSKGHMISHFKLNVIRYEDLMEGNKRVGYTIWMEKARGDAGELSDALSLILGDIGLQKDNA